MLVRQLFEKESSTYTYLLADMGAREAMLIDPVLEKVNDYIELISGLGVTLKLAVDTHTHADHITALGELRDRLACATMVGAESHADCATHRFLDGDKINVGNASIQVIHTPGHTDDSYSFYLRGDMENAGKLFTGDTLLIRGTGRTDFQNGDAHLQYKSLHEKLLTLPDETEVYPGHDYRGWTQSSIGEERQFNSRLHIHNADAYAKFMSKLALPTPKLMDIAVPRNQSCGKSL